MNLSPKAHGNIYSICVKYIKTAWPQKISCIYRSAYISGSAKFSHLVVAICLTRLKGNLKYLEHPFRIHLERCKRHENIDLGLQHVGLRVFMFCNGMFSTDSKTMLDVYCLVGDNTLTLTPDYFYEVLLMKWWHASHWTSDRGAGEVIYWPIQKCFPTSCWA